MIASKKNGRKPNPKSPTVNVEAFDKWNKEKLNEFLSGWYIGWSGACTLNAAKKIVESGILIKWTGEIFSDKLILLKVFSECNDARKKVLPPLSSGRTYECNEMARESTENSCMYFCVVLKLQTAPKINRQQSKKRNIIIWT